MAKSFYKIQFGIELKSYYDQVPNDNQLAKDLIYTNKGEFQKVEGSPSFGDILLIKLFNIECHIAVYLGEGKILHTCKGTGCMIDKFSKWERMVTGTYRVKD